MFDRNINISTINEIKKNILFFFKKNIFYKFIFS